MTTGFSAANLANKWLDMLGGTAFTAPAASALRLHTADPGSAGTTAGSAETTRKAITWAAASAGSKAATTTLPSWTAWSAGTETISHFSIWDNVTAGAGNFLMSGAWTASRTINNGDTLNVTSLSVSLTPIAA